MVWFSRKKMSPICKGRRSYIDLHKMSFGNHSLAFLRYSINIFVAKLHYKFDVQKSISVDVRLMNDS